MAMDFTEVGYFFDSFERSPSYNDVELQSSESNLCGYHVIAFRLSRINSMYHYDYISMFSDNLTLNNG